MTYPAISQLLKHHAVLHDSILLASGLQLAAWSNRHAEVDIVHDHPVLSLYIRGGRDTLYKSPGSIRLNEQVFADDARIAALFRHFLLGADWHDSANHLQISASATLLLQHLVRHYSNVGWDVPAVRGRLDAARLRRLQEWVEAHLDMPLTLADLARQACLSEYHFARLFKAASGQSPHEYVMTRRLERARQMICHSALPLADIAVQCGFASAAHLSRRFRAHFGCTPSHMRQAARAFSAQM